MDPRRILLRTDPKRPGIADLIQRIPGVREVILTREGELEIPGIRIRKSDEAVDTASKATLIITEKTMGGMVDLLLIPEEIQDDHRPLTDHLLILIRSVPAATRGVCEFLDQITTREVHLLTEGETGSDLILHAPDASITKEMVSGDPVQALLDAAVLHHPSLIMVSGHLSEPDLLRLLGAGHPIFIPYQGGGPVEVRELRSGEFPDANRVWVDYHETIGDPEVDRIFAAFEGGEIVSLARCRHHPDGSSEVDAVFTPEGYRGRGLSRQVVGALVEACYNEELSMYAVQHLKKFYAGFGFVPVPEGDLPVSVRERYLWAAGNMEGAEVVPMKRPSGRPALLIRVDTHK